MNWQLYGYDRETNPRLSQVRDLVVFRNMLTQSNTTHKSVPLILSSVNTDEHEELYRRKGLPALFNEAGFDTWFISNQSRQGAMIDNLAHDARHLIYIRSPRYDMQLLDEVRKVLENSDSQKILIVLHCYGSHFSYHQRYPREFAHFRPEGDVRSPNSTGRRSSMPTTIRSATRTISSPRPSPISARSRTPPPHCSTAPTTAKTSSTTTANGSCTPRPPRRPISST